MKLNTDEEAIQKGFDPSVVAAYGNIDFLHIFSAQFHDEIDLGYPISTDERVHELSARLDVPPILHTMKFKCEPWPDRRIKPRFLDVMGLSSLTGDSSKRGGSLRGIRTIISQSACDKLAPYLKNECVFVPTEVEGAPEPYYILWVRTICDAIDENHTSLARDLIFPNKMRPIRPVFRLDGVSAKYLFRLPQWKYITMDCDLASKAFRDLVKQLNIKGFEFRAGSLMGPLVK
jgi:hypothetical protein